MKRVIAVANQKGGVGKTTTAVNLAASLAATKRHVMLIDLDPQGNATMGSGVDKSQLQWSSCNVLLGETDIASALVRVDPGGFDLLPSNQDLTAAEVRLLTMMAGRETKLRNAVAPLRESYDVILIDCPPALNMLTVNSLVAADSVLIPMQCEYYALEGLSALVATIDQIKAAVNETLEIEGILRTMFDPRNNLANEVSAQLIMHFGDKVFRTIIPRNIRLAEAPSFGKPVLFHDRESRGALAYLALAGEMIRREEEERDAAAAAASASDAAAIATNEASRDNGAGNAVAPDTTAATAAPEAITPYATVHDAASSEFSSGNNSTGAPDVQAHSTALHGSTTQDAAHSEIATGETTTDEPTAEDDMRDEPNPAAAHSGR